MLFNQYVDVSFTLNYLVMTYYPGFRTVLLTDHVDDVVCADVGAMLVQREGQKIANTKLPTHMFQTFSRTCPFAIFVYSYGLLQHK
jgi:hypothetical protein